VYIRQRDVSEMAPGLSQPSGRSGPQDIESMVLSLRNCWATSRCHAHVSVQFLGSRLSNTGVSIH